MSSVHSISTPNCVTVGSTDALNKTLSLLDGDCFVCDEFAYGAAVSTGEALGRRCLGVRGDAEGMLPDALRETVLRGRAAGLNPDIVYLVPVGHNPTGSSMSERRKAEIYRVCQELDIIVVEDGKFQVRASLNSNNNRCYFLRD
jgi:aromatic amino acid aminotransferase I